jgi:hypothetical protein
MLGGRAEAPLEGILLLHHQPIFSFLASITHITLLLFAGLSEEEILQLHSAPVGSMFDRESSHLCSIHISELHKAEQRDNKSCSLEILSPQHDVQIKQEQRDKACS